MEEGELNDLNTSPWHFFRRESIERICIITFRSERNNLLSCNLFPSDWDYVFGAEIPPTNFLSRKTLRASLLTSLTFNVVVDIIKIHPTSVYNHNNNQQYRVTVVFAMITRRNFLTTKRLPFYSLFIFSNNKKILLNSLRKISSLKGKKGKGKSALWPKSFRL